MESSYTLEKQVNIIINSCHYNYFFKWNNWYSIFVVVVGKVQYGSFESLVTTRKPGCIENEFLQSNLLGLFRQCCWFWRFSELSLFSLYLSVSFWDPLTQIFRLLFISSGRLWCNGYRHWTWTRPSDFRFWMRLFVSHWANTPGKGMNSTILSSSIDNC